MPGLAYETYAAKTLAFFPRLARPQHEQAKSSRPDNPFFHPVGGH